MIRKRMLQILFPFFLFVACRSPSVDADDVGDMIDVAQQVVPPIVTEYVKSLTPTPTKDSRPAIQVYFDFASSPSCESVYDKVHVDGNEPFQSIRCYDDDITVRYDHWHLKATMEDVHQNFLAASAEVINETTWYDEENPDKPLGKFYQFTDSDGRANIIWTVNYPGQIIIGELSGWAVRTDGNHEALKTWWSEIGSVHN